MDKCANIIARGVAVIPAKEAYLSDAEADVKTDYHGNVRVIPREEVTSLTC